MMNELEIRTLTERFFDGDTTLAEERRLYELYSEAEGLPADLLPLREMMLDLGRLEAEKTLPQKTHPLRTLPRRLAAPALHARLHVVRLRAAERVRGLCLW